MFYSAACASTDAAPRNGRPSPFMHETRMSSTTIALDQSPAAHISGDPVDVRNCYAVVDAVATFYRTALADAVRRDVITHTLGPIVNNVYFSINYIGVPFGSLESMDAVVARCGDSVRDLQYAVAERRLGVSQWYQCCAAGERVPRAPFYKFIAAAGVDDRRANGIIDRLPRLHEPDRALIMRIVRMMLNVDEKQPDVRFGYIDHTTGSGASPFEQCYALTFSGLPALTYSFACMLAAHTDERLQGVLADAPAHRDDGPKGGGSGGGATRIVVFLRRGNSNLQQQPLPPEVLRAATRYRQQEAALRKHHEALLAAVLRRRVAGRDGHRAQEGRSADDGDDGDGATGGRSRKRAYVDE